MMLAVSSTLFQFLPMVPRQSHWYNHFAPPPPPIAVEPRPATGAGVSSPVMPHDAPTTAAAAPAALACEVTIIGVG